MTTCRETEAGECARRFLVRTAVEFALERYDAALSWQAFVADTFLATGDDSRYSVSEAEQRVERARAAIIALARQSVPATRTPTPRTVALLPADQLTGRAKALAENTDAAMPCACTD